MSDNQEYLMIKGWSLTMLLKLNKNPYSHIFIELTRDLVLKPKPLYRIVEVV